MWSRIISWILASITALMNGFGMYTQEYKPFAAGGEYTIQEEAVDYAALRSWYIASYGGSGTCKVERKPGSAGEPNMAQFVWLVEGGTHNPDAKLEFESGTVLLAPSKGKIMNSPNSSGNKIIVANDSKDYTAYRMEILNPEAWYCCVDEEPTSTGLYVHTNTDHRIDLAQGDIICIAGPKTTMKMWRGNSAGVLAECESLRDFMLYTSDEGGNADLSISAGGNLRPGAGGSGESGTGGSGESAPSTGVPGVPDANIFTGNGTWHMGANSRWWYTTGDPSDYKDGDYPASQYLYYQGNWYYFDSDGYMVEGWADDNHYYIATSWKPDGIGNHPVGSMCQNTVVPMNGYTDRFVFVNWDGFEDDENGQDSYTTDGHTYNRNGDYYEEVDSN